MLEFCLLCYRKPWIEDYLNKANNRVHLKSLDVAQLARKKGNRNFEKRNFTDALCCYNEVCKEHKVYTDVESCPDILMIVFFLYHYCHLGLIYWNLLSCYAIRHNHQQPCAQHPLVSYAQGSDILGANRITESSSDAYLELYAIVYCYIYGEIL